jgi:hypothetical protein
MTDNTLAQLSRLDTALAQATRIDEITDIRAKVEALRVYAVNIGASKDQCKEIAMARIKAERRAGQMLLSLPKRNGARPPDTGFIDTNPCDIDSILPSQRNSWQWIARLPDKLFDDMLLERYQSSDEITTQYFYRAAKIHIMRKSGINTDKPYTPPETITIDANDMQKAALVLQNTLSQQQIKELIQRLKV